MRLLIDTQIIIWALINPEKFSTKAINLLESNDILVSHISLFEIAIKQIIGKLPELDIPIVDLITQIEQDGFNILPLQNRHIEDYDAIPIFPEHRDPFDRILLATALSENIPILSADTNFKLYMPDVQIIMNS